MNTTSFPALVERFFTERLLNQMGASPHTIAAYRDTFRLLLRFAKESLGKAPSQLCMEDLDVAFVSKFLDHLENKRGNCTRTRNKRLAALHSFFQFVAIHEPALTLHCQRVLALPSKRFTRGPVAFLTDEETAALVSAPDPANGWEGETRFCCSSPFRPDSVTAKSHPCADEMSNSVSVLIYVASGKVVKCDARRCALTLRLSSRNGWPHKLDSPTVRSFPVPTVGVSAPTRYSALSRNTSQRLACVAPG
jgi:hypothetical protein